MSETILKATRRTIIGKHVKSMRREGKLPAIIYGRRIGTFPISLDLRETTLALRSLTSSALIKLEVDGDAYTVLIRDKQYHVIKNQLLHLDFQAVSMTDKLITEIPVRLHGTAPVLDEYEAMVMTKLDRLEVEAFPGDLPEYIEVDISGISELGDSVTVGSLDLGDKVAIRHADDEVIVIAISIQVAPEEEEEVEPVELEPELIARGKEEEEGEE